LLSRLGARSVSSVSGSDGDFVADKISGDVRGTCEVERYTKFVIC
jgi:hypothetical protein